MANTKFRILNLGNTNYEVGDWYGISNTAANTQTKTVTITGFDSNSLVDGVRVVVRFNNMQSYSGTPYLNVSGTGRKPIYNDTSPAVQYEWKAWQIISFIYNNALDAWVIENGAYASTNFWGKIRLSNTIANNETFALTPKAVYDAGYATTSQIPTKTSDLTNDSGYLTLADLPIYNGGVS